MNEFCNFIADQKSEKTKHKTKYDKQTLCKFCRWKNDKREVKELLFLWFKNDLQTCNSYVF